MHSLLASRNRNRANDRARQRADGERASCTLSATKEQSSKRASRSERGARGTRHCNAKDSLAHARAPLAARQGYRSQGATQGELSSARACANGSLVRWLVCAGARVLSGSIEYTAAAIANSSARAPTNDVVVVVVVVAAATAVDADVAADVVAYCIETSGDGGQRARPHPRNAHPRSRTCGCD